MTAALSPLRRTLASALIGLLAGAVPAGDAPPKAGGPGKPLSPQEAQKQFRLDPGLRIELVAAEPTIQSPVAMTFDPQGRIWVVEMQDYPNGPAKGVKPRGRIRILEDKDGDGYYESATTFADNLLFANGLLLWKDGAIVTMAPHIVHLRDTDGDGKADKKDILYEGFAAQNPQLRVSHPILGVDGWIYCANGLRGGKAIRSPLSPWARGAGGEVKAMPVDLSGMDFRFDPVTGAYEAITGMGQYGNTFDEWGNRFVCDNRHHLRHIVMETRYLKRNPYLAAPSLVQDVSVLDDGPLSSGGKIYPLSRNWTTSSLHEGRFTAACSVFIYHGQLLDQSRDRQGAGGKPLPDGRGSDGRARYHGAAFTCDPTGNLVHMEILTPKGATFTSKPHRKGVEFLATPDDWFRPVFLTHGPDGAMYVVDMYRAVIEHPQFMPPELQHRPDLTLGRDKGRIWRIVPEKHVTKAIRPNLAKASIAELVKTLEHSEPWWRTTAQRLLLERNDKAAIEPLTALLGITKRAHAAILAAWLLERDVKLTDRQVVELMRNSEPRVREHGVRLAEQRFRDKRFYDSCRVELLASDLDARVRFQTALSLGGLEGSDQVLIEIALRGLEDHWARLAVASAAPKSAAPILGRIVTLPKVRATAAGQALIRELAEIVGAQKDDEQFFHAWMKLKPGVGLQMSPAQLAGWVGFAEGLERRGKKLTNIDLAHVDNHIADQIRQVIGDVIEDTTPPANDPKVPIAERVLGIRLFAHIPWQRAKKKLMPLAESPEQEIRLAAVRALAAFAEEEASAVLLKTWPSASPPVRREILEAMLRRPERVTALLDAIAAKRVKASEIDASRTRQLVAHRDPSIRERARKLLQDNLPAERQAVLKQYRAALGMKGDPKRGREIFKKNCATCHRVAGIGTDVGPDIADTRTKTLAALLNDIVVPNQAIDNNYINYLVSTKDGRVLTGILAAETATSVTLKRAEGQSDVVLRKEIDEITSTGISLMPEGLEKEITVPQMADLLRFLKDWRYLDGSVPTAPPGP